MKDSLRAPGPDTTWAEIVASIESAELLADLVLPPRMAALVQSSLRQALASGTAITGADELAEEVRDVAAALTELSKSRAEDAVFVDLNKAARAAWAARMGIPWQELRPIHRAEIRQQVARAFNACGITPGQPIRTNTPRQSGASNRT